MAGSLGSLVVSLAAETAQFREDMGKAAYVAQKNFKSIQNSAQTLAAGLGIYFSANMFVGWIKSSIDAADAMYILSQKTGIATDTLSKLQYAAKLNEVSAEDFGSSINRLNKNIAEAARGTGTAKEAFDAMGIAVKDSSGNIKDTTILLGETADKFARYEDGANKTALAVALFGKAGTAMIPMLNEGKAGIEAMGKELERLGGVVFPDAAKRANEFNDNLDRIKVSSNAAAMEIGNSLLPYLKDLSDQFLVARKNGLSFMDMLLLGAESPWADIQNQIKNLASQAEALTKMGLGDSAITNSIKRREAYFREMAAMQDLAKSAKATQSQLGANSDKGGNLKAPALGSSSGKSKVDEVTKALEKQTEAVNKLLYSESQLAVQEVFLAGGTLQQIEQSQALADTYDRLKKATEDSIELQREYKTLYDQTAAPIQKLADEEARLISLRDKLIANGYDVVQVENMISEARMNAASMLDTKPMKSDLDELKDSVQQFSNAISTAFEEAIISGGNFSDMLRGLENTILQIATRILVTKPLERALEGVFSSFMPGGGSSDWLTQMGTSIGSFIFGGAKAGGGAVFPGQAYLVGERGPEIFAPQSSGTIIPNESAAYSTTININVTGVSNSDDMRRSASQIASMAALAVARGRRNL